jgi:hypothetical protein
MKPSLTERTENTERIGFPPCPLRTLCETRRTAGFTLELRQR